METAVLLRQGNQTSAPSDGSRTITMTNTPTREGGSTSTDEGEGRGQAVGVLRLRPKRMGNRVAWDEEVVDNEGAGKKKSKICCIYHKPKRYDESSDESSDSDSDSDDGRRPSHSHSHPHSHSHSHPHDSLPTVNGGAASSQSNPTQSEVVHQLDLADDEPNAYEKAPPPPKNAGKGKRKDVSS